MTDKTLQTLFTDREFCDAELGDIQEHADGAVAPQMSRDINWPGAIERASNNRRAHAVKYWIPPSETILLCRKHGKISFMRQVHL